MVVSVTVAGEDYIPHGAGAVVLVTADFGAAVFMVEAFTEADTMAAATEVITDVTATTDQETAEVTVLEAMHAEVTTELVQEELMPMET